MLSNAGNTSLHLACEENLTDLVALLGPSPAYFNIRNKDDKSPLHMTSDKHMHRALEEYIESF